ncbi:MAG: penicillin-insensitive murein endopeptidase, partial [Pseudomonadota bacterium]
LAPEPHGTYSNGCMAGGSALPITGPIGANGAPRWQAMRLSRNRYYGLPEIVGFIERLSLRAQEIGWPGIFVGDVSQPRGGPMTSGHRSHQIGLDADIWMRPAEGRELARSERERFGSFSVVRGDGNDVNGNWTPAHAAVLQAAAEDVAVARIFVNPAIKKRLCRDAAGGAWLRKIRPWYGHDAHFHVRLSCPFGAGDCVNQDPPPPGDGCDASLDWWFSEEARNPKPDPNKPKRPRRELTLADLPAACGVVLDAE